MAGAILAGIVMDLAGLALVVSDSCALSVVDRSSACSRIV